MSTPHPGLRAGVFNFTAHERVLFGSPAAEAVVAESERYGGRRVFITSTRSLAQKEDGPLQRLERALGGAHVGTYAGIKSHSPREDVVAGANAARAARADLLVAVGGGSVIDATKAMLLCLWAGLDTPEAMEPYCLGFERAYFGFSSPPPSGTVLFGFADGENNGGAFDSAHDYVVFTFTHNEDELLHL